MSTTPRDGGWNSKRAWRTWKTSCDRKTRRRCSRLSKLGNHPVWLIKQSDGRNLTNNTGDCALFMRNLWSCMICRGLSIIAGLSLAFVFIVGPRCSSLAPVVYIVFFRPAAGRCASKLMQSAVRGFHQFISVRLAETGLYSADSAYVAHGRALQAMKVL